jgi:hypothetical protein
MVGCVGGRAPVILRSRQPDLRIRKSASGKILRRVLVEAERKRVNAASRG